MNRDPAASQAASARAARINHRLITEAIWDIEAFEAGNPQQRHLKGVLLTMLAHMQASCCRPTPEGARQQEATRELARWWGHVKRYRKTLFSPALAGKGRQRVLAKLLG